MSRFEERKQETNGNGLDPLLAQSIDNFSERSFVQVSDDGATAIYATWDAEAKRARHEGGRLVRVNAVDQLWRPIEPTDFQDIAKSLVRDQGGPSALALDHRVRRDRGAVADPGKLAGLDAYSIHQPLDAGHDRFRSVRMAIEYLGDLHRAGQIIH